MEISEKLLCVFTAKVEEQDDTYVIEVPKRELNVGDVELAEGYRTALFPSRSSDRGDQSGQTRESSRAPHPEPPATEGETRTVEIENTGEQGDGITRVERGYVIIVPETTPGDRVKIKVTDVQENVAFAEVLEHEDT
ncbi:TRAM domain-containing protein [Natronococcus occultus]|uniref:Putative RNA-binding protein, contains TRAM domain n=1 Tax=Natronococcus occultus SP4 TaxID=694430 RepID=L0JVI4_9EURY|nr:TRAM domain-containing protein [Natronococcus occultus]AGB37047.1 putative RNA-binding protein, contains TRAM domain [Natronococcus occultus SP4]